MARVPGVEAGQPGVLKAAALERGIALHVVEEQWHPRAEHRDADPGLTLSGDDLLHVHRLADHRADPGAAQFHHLMPAVADDVGTPGFPGC